MLTAFIKTINMFKTVTRRRGALHAIDLLSTMIIEKLPGPLARGIPGRKKELFYWEKQITGAGAFASAMVLRVNRASQKDLFPTEMLEIVDRVKKEFPERKMPLVLDVGSGPISLLTWGFHEGFFDLVTVDPLADDYAKLLKAYGHDAAVGSIKSIQSVSEDISRFIVQGSFDIVYCNNALDHTTSPRRSLEEMVKAVKSGGYIMISGRSHEGSHEGFDAIHQHDLYLENGTLMRKGKDTEGEPLTSGLNLDTVSAVTPKDFFGKMRIVLKKMD